MGQEFEMAGHEVDARASSEPRESLWLSEERFRLLVESIRDYAIFMLSPGGYVSTWNAGAAFTKGYEASEVIGQHFSIFYPESDARSDQCAYQLELAAAEGRFEDEGFRVRKDGSQFWANVVITALRDAEGKLVGFAKVTRDLTERRRAEEERVRLRQAQDANRAKDEFLATISHELRTPLNAILGWATLLGTRTDAPELLTGLETIRRNAQAQAKLVEDVLDVSRIVTGKLRLELKTTELATLVRDAVDVVRPAADARGVSLQFECVSVPPPMIADPVRLSQTVWNLVSNAVKFTEPGGSVLVRLHHVESHVILTVRDTGQGIDGEFLPHVFERFRQADSSSRRRHGGLGLGLAIVRHVVELHGGTVSAASPGVGQGAEFAVRLPLRAATAQVDEPQADVRDPSADGRQLHGARVLVVDDDADSRELARTILEEHGAELMCAGSASEGREYVASFRPHVIVCDVGMPEEDGYDFMRSVRAFPRERGQATPAIALTAYVRPADRLRALSAGFNNHLAKPVDAEELVQLVRNLSELVRGGTFPY